MKWDCRILTGLFISGSRNGAAIQARTKSRQQSSTQSQCEHNLHLYFLQEFLHCTCMSPKFSPFCIRISPTTVHNFNFTCYLEYLICISQAPNLILYEYLVKQHDVLQAREKELELLYRRGRSPGSSRATSPTVSITLLRILLDQRMNFVLHEAKQSPLYISQITISSPHFQL